VERDKTEYSGTIIGRLKSPDWRGRAYGAVGDVLNEPDTISLDELRSEEGEYDRDLMSLVGIDPLTPVDSFLAMQGRTSFLTET